MLGQDITRLLIVPSDERWIAFVNSMSSANIFHHPAWINLMAECYGYRPFVVAICDRNGEIQVGLPLMEVNSWLTGHRWVSLPFTDHCLPLSRNNIPLQELFEFLSDLRTKHDIPSVEIRSAIPYKRQTHEDNSQVLHLLKLSSDTQTIFSNFHRKRVQHCIAKAEREGVTVQWAESRRDLDAFYDLHLRTRHRLGVPVQPKRYFELLWEQIICTGLGIILLARKDSLPIAGAVFLTFNNILTFKYAASDRDYWHLSPNNLLIWVAIRWGCEHGHTLFDMGKTDVDNIGLRNFKSGWGTQESSLTYSIQAATRPNRIGYRLADLAETFIRHTPRWVCRVTGELFYKHFA